MQLSETYEKKKKMGKTSIFRRAGGCKKFFKGFPAFKQNS